MIHGAGLTAVVLVLLGSVAAHLGQPRSLVGALRAHWTLPSRLVVPVAIGIIAAEAALGLLPLAVPTAGLLAAGALLTGYGAYDWYVLRTRPPVPCGCAGSADAPLGSWTVVRTLTLALLSVLAAFTPHPHGAGQTAVAVTAGATLAVLLWSLPAALHDPLTTAQEAG